MKCLICGTELLFAVESTVKFGGPQVCGKCIDRSEKVAYAITRDDLEKYLIELSLDVRLMFNAAEKFVKESADTLSEDFQLASAIEDLFWKRAYESRKP